MAKIFSILQGNTAKLFCGIFYGDWSPNVILLFRVSADKILCILWKESCSKNVCVQMKKNNIV
jgi:hypothetical protein